MYGQLVLLLMAANIAAQVFIKVCVYAQVELQLERAKRTQCIQLCSWHRSVCAYFMQ
jgi:hypothetical protein